MEECASVFNHSDPLRDAILLEESDLGTPCTLQNHLVISKNWYGYLAVAKLKAKEGRIYYHFVYPEHKCCIKILLYLEEQVLGLRAHMNCLQKQAALDPRSNQVITLSPSSPSSGCTSNRTADGTRVIECSSGRILRSDSDRVWRIAASSCGSPSGLDIHYSIVIYGYNEHIEPSLDWMDSSVDNLCPRSLAFRSAAQSTLHHPQFQHSIPPSFSTILTSLFILYDVIAKFAIFALR